MKKKFKRSFKSRVIDILIWVELIVMAIIIGFTVFSPIIFTFWFDNMLWLLLFFGNWGLVWFEIIVFGIILTWKSL